MTQAQQAYERWHTSTPFQPLRDVAEEMGGTIALSDDLYVAIEMPDCSCVVDSACSESTYKSVEDYLETLEEFENQEYI